MSARNEVLKNQISLIEGAMKKAGLWSHNVPDWIRTYKEGPIENVWQWLQFIHLPMRRNGNIDNSRYLAPQVSAHLESDTSHDELLQLIIELDSITSTLHKT